MERSRTRTSHTRWLHLQASQWADHESRAEVARRLYTLRFADKSLAEGKTVDQLRGMEGHRVKNAYRTMSQRYGIPFRRAYNPQNFDESDPVNQALTTANQVLYSAVHSVMQHLVPHRRWDSYTQVASGPSFSTSPTCTNWK